MIIKQIFKLLYPRNEVKGLFYTGITLSVRLSVCPSVDAWLGKLFQSHTCFPFIQMIMKFTHRLHMNHRSVILIFGSKGQESRSQCIDKWKCFMSHYPLPLYIYFHVFSWNNIHRLLISRGSDLLILGSKVKITMNSIQRWFMLHNWFPFTPIIMTLHTQFLLKIWGQKVKDQSFKALITENSLSHNCFSFTPIIIKIHTQRLLMSPGCVLLLFVSTVQAHNAVNVV